MIRWRYWFAFETRPGVRRGTEDDRSAHWRALAASCRKPNGRLDAAEYDSWLEFLIDREHQWADV